MRSANLWNRRTRIASNPRCQRQFPDRYPRPATRSIRYVACARRPHRQVATQLADIYKTISLMFPHFRPEFRGGKTAAQNDRATRTNEAAEARSHAGDMVDGQAKVQAILRL